MAAFWGILKGLFLALPELLKLARQGWDAIRAWQKRRADERAAKALAAAIVKSKQTGDTTGIEEIFRGKRD